MMRTKSVLSMLALAFMLGCAQMAAAQQSREEPDMTINAAMRVQVIDEILKKLNEAYVFPEVAKKMEQAIRERLQRKEYETITSASKFAELLTSNLQGVSHDKHLRVNYSYEAYPPEGERREPTPEERESFNLRLRAMNYGFEKVERLPGNIGYLDLRGFMPADVGGETVVAAMNFLSNTDALIIDLRQNGGGSPGMVALISSYLFRDITHLNDLYWREGETTQQFWTAPYVPGKRYVDKDVYVLTSKRTFSAAEEFTYNLKNLKRATIVGETTGGGAHPGGPSRISDHFDVWVPRGRAINPTSKTNWEGTGVEPDVKVSAPEALKTAHLAAVNKAMGKISDPRRKDQLKDLAQTLQRELDELKNKQKPTP
ncbi:MAG: S41 family peptidase [Acidobacteriota bacterium]